MCIFDAVKVKKDCVDWIRSWFEQNGKSSSAFIGISGGKDSSVVAALCTEALGRDRVCGVLMPNGEQEDIECSYQLVKHLGIRWVCVNIDKTVQATIDTIAPLGRLTQQAMQNLPPRARMMTLYAISQMFDGRVSCNTNACERYIGYGTVWGDIAGDFAPILNLTVSQVKAVGLELGLPINLISKAPTDGLCGMTDEDRFGFTYKMLEGYMCTGQGVTEEVRSRIEMLHKRSEFKRRSIAAFELN